MAKIDALNFHPQGSDGPMVIALNRYNKSRVLAEVSGDLSRICDITAHELARTHASYYYNNDSKRTKGVSHPHLALQ